MNTIATVLGYQTIRGSSSRKAVSGLLAAMKHVRAGNKFSIAIDGPKGPIYEVKDGIIAISKKTNTKIVPIVTTPKRFYTFEKAWNKARFPYPFNSIEVKVGEIKEYTREELEKMLTSLDER